MTISNAQLLAKLDSAFKNVIEIDDFGEAILQPTKFNRFIQQVEQSTVVLPEARFIRMDSQRVDIDRTGFVNRILRSGRSAASGGGIVRELQAAQFAQISTFTNQLNARELQAIASLRDDALRRNIERGNFENTLIDLFAAAAGRDLEEFALLADTNIPFDEDDVLSQTDGWARRAAQKLYGRGVNADFDPDDAAFPENMLNEMLAALPKQYLGNVADWRFYVTFNVYDGYRDLLRARGTQLGDTAQTTAAPLYFKGIPVVYAPFLERARSVVDVSADIIEGEIAMLTNPDNMAWGVFHQVTIEREREAKLRRTDFVLAFEGDADYEDENAAVVALIDKERPS